MTTSHLHETKDLNANQSYSLSNLINAIDEFENGSFRSNEWLSLYSYMLQNLCFNCKKEDVQELLKQLCRTNGEGYNILMITLLYDSLTLSYLLDFLKKNFDSLDPAFLRKIVSQRTALIGNSILVDFEMDTQGRNLIVDFLSCHPNIYDSKTLREMCELSTIEVMLAMSGRRLSNHFQALLGSLIASTGNNLMGIKSKVENGETTWEDAAFLLFICNPESLRDLFLQQQRTIASNKELFNSFITYNSKFILQNIGRDNFCGIFIACIIQSSDATVQNIEEALKSGLNTDSPLGQFFAKHHLKIGVGETTAQKILGKKIVEVSASFNQEKLNKLYDNFLGHQTLLLKDRKILTTEVQACLDRSFDQSSSEEKACASFAKFLLMKMGCWYEEQPSHSRFFPSHQPLALTDATATALLDECVKYSDFLYLPALKHRLEYTGLIVLFAETTDLMLLKQRSANDIKIALHLSLEILAHPNIQSYSNIQRCAIDAITNIRALLNDRAGLFSADSDLQAITTEALKACQCGNFTLLKPQLPETITQKFSMNLNEKLTEALTTPVLCSIFNLQEPLAAVPASSYLPVKEPKGRSLINAFPVLVRKIRGDSPDRIPLLKDDGLIEEQPDIKQKTPLVILTA